MARQQQSTEAQATPGPPSARLDEDEDWTPTPSAPQPAKAEKKAGRPAWIRPQRLVEFKNCPKCQARIAAGYDADVCAWLATVDSDIFLTAEGEERAVLRGRRTYDWITTPSRKIEHRDESHRRGRPAAAMGLSRPNLVVVQHVCGRPVPDWARFEPPQKRRTASSDKPPF